MRSAYLYDDYRRALKLRLGQLKKSLGSSYSLKCMAEHVGIQPSYISRVLMAKGHFDDDQLYKASYFLKYSSSEMEYLEYLRQLQRSSSRIRKQELKSKLQDIKNKNLRLEPQLKFNKVQGEERNYDVYFLNPNYQKVHMLLTIPRFAQDLELIETDLGLSSASLAKILDYLLENNIISISDSNKIEVLQETIFLKPDSPVFNRFHTLSKIDSLQKIESLQKDQKHCLSLKFTCSKKTWEKVTQGLIEWSQNTEKLIEEDKNEEGLYQIHYDLFPWAGSQ